MTQSKRAALLSLLLIMMPMSVFANCNAINRINRLIVYDNEGEWVRRFQLKHLPAKIVHQGGLSLTVIEGIDDDAI